MALSIMMKNILSRIQAFLIAQKISKFLPFEALFQTQVLMWVNLSALILLTPSFLYQIFIRETIPPFNKFLVVFIYVQIIIVLVGVRWASRNLSLKKYCNCLWLSASAQVLTSTAALFGFAYATGSFHSSAFFWLPLMPITLSYFTKPRYGVLLAILCCILISHFYFYFYIQGHLNLAKVNDFSRGQVHYFDALASLGFAAFLAWIYDTTKNRLRKKVLESEKEVEAQRDKLFKSAKFHSLGEMAASLAHEINNPLFMIQGKVHSMRNLMRKKELDREKYDDIVDSVESILMNLSKVIRGVSNFARSEDKGQMTYISLKNVIEDTMVFCSERLQGFAIELEVNIRDEVKLYCYPSFISQILLNLVNNAVDSLCEQEGKKYLSLTLVDDVDEILLEVYDNGKGVEQDVLEQIFTPFYTTKPYGKGTGLGLSISQSLAREHGGELRIKPANSGKGVSFILCLPHSLKEGPFSDNNSL